MDPFAVAYRLKAEGNEDFRHGRYTAAIRKYDGALTILVNCNNLSWPLEVAILFCNRSMCFYHLQQWQEAFFSALHAIETDPFFIKAYYWGGSALLKIGNIDGALQYFHQGLDYIRADTHRDFVADLIVGIVTTEKRIGGLFCQVLESVLHKRYSTDIWKLVIEKIARKNLWRDLHVLIQVGMNQLPNDLSASQISMKSLFEQHVLDTQSQYYKIDWLPLLFKWLISHGSSIESIGNFPLHTIMVLSIKSGESELIKMVLTQKPALLHRINEQDSNGATLLHVVASFRSDRRYSQKCQTDHVEMLLKMGANPNIADRQKKLAADYLKKNKNFKAVEAIKKQTPRVTLQESAASFSYEGDATTNAKSMTFEEAVARFAQFCTANNEKHIQHLLDRPEVHPLMQHLSTCSEIPLEIICDVDVSFAKSFVKQSLERKKWHETLLVLTGRSDELKRKGGGLFPTFSLSDLNLCHYIPHFKFEKQRIPLVSCLLEKGASPNRYGAAEESPLELCFKGEDYKMAHLLLEKGANLQGVSICPGDTPLHAALYIALEKKDEFGLHILKYLLEKYSKDTTKYACLDPNVQDNEGNTLLHIIFQTNYSRHLEEIMDMLSKFDINIKIKNNLKKEATFKVSGKDPRLLYWNKAQMKNKKKQESNLKSQRSKPVKSLINSKNSKPKATPEMGGEDSVGKPESCGQVQPVEEECKPCTVRESLVYEIETMIQLVEWASASTNAGASVSKPSKAKVMLEQPTCTSDKAGIPESFEESAVKPGVLEIQEAEPVVEETQPYEIPEENCLQLLDIDNMTWEIECTSDVLKKIASKDVSLNMKAKIVQVIQQLGNGEWTSSLQKKLKYSNSEIKLYEAKLDKGARMLWELAIDFSPRCSENPEKIIETEQSSHSTDGATGKVYSEMIRVWDIVTDHDKLKHAINVICQAFNRGSSCILKKKLKGLNRAKLSSNLNTEKCIPLCYVEYVDSHNVEENKIAKYFPPASAVETEYNIMKFHSFSTNMALNIIRNMDTKVEYPFRVGELEYAIIDLNPKPLEAIILIGRSGTGKTTCCLFRLWKQYQKYWVNAEQAGEPLLGKPMWQKRQPVQDHDVDTAKAIAVVAANEAGCPRSRSDESDTASSEDEDESSDSACCAMISVCEDGLKPDVDDIDQQESTQLEHLHQVFVTKNHVLCKEVQKNFIELSKSMKATSHFRPLEPNIYRLQDIQDEHFPLFITSKQFLLLLDASMPHPFFPRNPDGSLKRNIVGWSALDDLILPELIDDEEEGEFEDELDDEEKVTEIQMKETDPRLFVTYDVFSSEIWPKMVKGKHPCNPALVWKEIKSFLKGSFEAFNSSDGMLTEEEYNKLGKKRAPNFQEDRSEIYRLFRLYQQIKSQRGFFDEEDVLYNLSQRFAKLDEISWSIHELYGDEIQDFTQAELTLLMKVINDPNAMFLTGDTAQSIMKGVAFRFSDLRSLFYYASKSNTDKKKRFIVRKPKRIYQLYQNYRSHSGILYLASGVVDLLQHFFPESFDRLPRDQGLFDGPKPTLLESCSVSDLAILLRGNKRKSQPIEFGAHQVILVANETAKETIPEELHLALVLTIYEAKGLEFDDVLLYNFFTDSEAGKEWRVISSFNPSNIQKPESGTLAEVPLEETDIPQSRPLEFNADLHKMLNGELKQLYTAVTRARVNLWLFDENREKRRPAFEYFIKRRYAQVVRTDENTELDDSMFVKTSTQQEWVERGDYFAKNQCWKVAAKCYQKGGAEDKEKLALAHDSVLNVRSKKTSSKEMQLEYLRLSKIYLECNVPKLSMKCLKNAKEFRLCAQLCERLGKMKDAAVCYRKAGCYRLSAKCFEKACEFDSAIKTYCRAELFDEVAEALERYEQKPEIKLPYTKDQFYLEAAVKYHKENNHAAMIKSLSKLNPDDQLVFFKRHNYLKEAADVLKSLCREEEAAVLMREHGNLIKAAELTNKMDFRAECLLADARRSLSNVTWETSLEASKVDRINEMLEEALRLFDDTNQVYGAAEVKLLCGILIKNSKNVEDALELFVNEGHSAGATEALCLMLQLPLSRVSALRLYLKGLEMLLLLVKALEKPATNEEKEMVKSCYDFYGIIQVDSSQCRIPKNEAGRVLQFMFDCDTGLKDKLTSEDTYYRLQTSDLKFVLKSHLLSRLCDSAEKIKSQGQNVPDVCFKYISGLQCKTEGCTDIHRPLQRHEAQHAIQSKVYLTALNGLLLEAQMLFKKSTFPEVDKILNILTGDPYALCKSLVNTVFPKHFHQRVVSDNAVACKVVLSLTRNIPFRHYKSVLREYITKCFENKSDCVKRECTDLWLEATKVSILFSEYPKYVELRLKNEEFRYRDELKKHQPKGNRVPGSRGMVTTDKGGKEHMCFFQLLLLSMQELYHKENPETCIHAFYRFMNVPVMRCSETLIPDIGNTVMLIEFQFVLGCAVLMRFCKNLTVCLPKSYIALLHFWDFMFKGKDVSSIIHFFHPIDTQKTIFKMKKHLSYLAGVMCGERNEKFNVLQDAFESRYTASGETERTVVLCLVMLVNIEQALDLDSRCRYLLRENFITAANKLKTLQDNEPSQISVRLIKIVEKVNVSRSIREVVESLQELLIERDDEYLQDCKWDNSYKGICFQKVYLKRYSDALLPVHLSPQPQRDDKENEEHFEEEADETLKVELHRKNIQHRWRDVIGKCILLCRAVAAMQAKPEPSHPEHFMKADIDRTQCDLCGVKFRKNMKKHSEEQMEDAQDDESLSTEEKEIPEDNEMCDKEDYETHLSSTEHKQKQKDYENYLTYFTQSVDSLITKSKTILHDLEEGTKSNISAKEQSKTVAEKLKSCIQNMNSSIESIYKRKDWDSGIKKLHHPIKSLGKVLEDAQNCLKNVETGLYNYGEETEDMRDNSLEDDGAEEHEEFEELKGKAKKSNKKGRVGKKKKR
ncbi:TPR and ankyrin repeat-containing protein 1-like isoform X2 [Polyodon spathula]|nr:TPR and ankyrin repeat-containing protein 1-like isoform X2 [Polyodon spathula]XP_041100860.1 TPR and ankyrin repeat-containing protein 1-like isoform X2 [Polyodon spathula]